MSAESLDPSNAVFIAIPLEHVEHCQEMETIAVPETSAEVNRSRRTKGRNHESALFLAFVAVTVFGACMPFFGPLIYYAIWRGENIRHTPVMRYSARYTAREQLVVVDELIGSEHHAIQLTESTFDKFLKDNPKVFVNFYAPWCVWSQRLFPTWQKVALAIQDEALPVAVAEVDCVAQPVLCREQNALSFPTLRWYDKGVAQMPHYTCDRTVDALVGFVESRLRMDNRTCDELQWEAVARHPSLSAEKEDGPAESVEQDAAQPLRADDLNAVVGFDRREAPAWAKHHKRNDFESVDGRPKMIGLTQASFHQLLLDNEMAFVRFCYTGRSGCRDTAWEDFSQKASNLHMEFGVGQVNCTAEPELCEMQGIIDFPALHWYQRGFGRVQVYYGGLSLQNLVDVAALNVNFKDRFTNEKLQSKYNSLMPKMLLNDIRGSSDEGSHVDIGDSEDSVRISGHIQEWDDIDESEDSVRKTDETGEDSFQVVNADINDKSNGESKDALPVDESSDDPKDTAPEHVEDESNDGGWKDIIEEIMDYWTMED